MFYKEIPSSFLNLLSTSIIDTNDYINMFEICYQYDFNLLTKVIFFMRNQYDGFNNRYILEHFLNYLYIRNFTLYLEFIKLLPKYSTWGEYIDEYSKQPVKFNILNRVKEQLEQDMISTKISNCAKWIPNENTDRDKKIGYFYKDLAKEFNKSRGEFRRDYIVNLRKKGKCMASFLNDKDPNIKLKDISNYKLRNVNNFLIELEPKKFSTTFTKLNNSELESSNMFLYYTCDKLIKKLNNYSPKSKNLFGKINKVLNKFSDLYVNLYVDNIKDYILMNTVYDNDNKVFILMMILLNLYFSNGENLYIPIIEDNTIIEYKKLSDYLGSTSIEKMNISKLIEIFKININKQTIIKDNNSVKVIITNNLFDLSKNQIKNLTNTDIVWNIKKGVFRWNFKNVVNLVGFNQYSIGLIAMNGYFSDREFLKNILKSKKYDEININ